MTVLPRKRRRKDSKETVSDSNGARSEEEESACLQDLFKQHFEATFVPLPEEVKFFSGSALKPDMDADEQLASDWEGFSDVDDEVQLVDAVTLESAGTSLPMEELKRFMSSKIPSFQAKPVRSNGQTSEDAEKADDNEATNLKNDLALQRLLKEAHLLEPHSTLSHLGSNRHKALDTRLQDMGSKSSIFAQPKMPMAQRKGIQTKAADREQIRRKDAFENGIVLEKAGRKIGKDKFTRRDRGVGAPSVGRFRGGTLKLNKKDLADIQGPKKVGRKR